MFGIVKPCCYESGEMIECFTAVFSEKIQQERVAIEREKKTRYSNEVFSRFLTRNILSKRLLLTCESFQGYIQSVLQDGRSR